MAKGINKVILIGNLGADPEIRQTTTGSSVARISVATTESWTDKQSGNKEERTEWHRVVFFNRLAEVVGEYLRKGSKVYVEGSIRTNKWQDQAGNDRYTTEIIANGMQMLDSRSIGMAPQHSSNNCPEVKATNIPKQSVARSTSASTDDGSSGKDAFDDIPF